MPERFDNPGSMIPLSWSDPSGSRSAERQRKGLTMVIDKGAGISAFRDLLELASPYIDICKLGFGTAALYPTAQLRQKLELAKAYGLQIMPGGTFFEIALLSTPVSQYMETICQLGFTAVEISDGTFPLSQKERREAIMSGLACGLTVYTEFGKKDANYRAEKEELLQTLAADLDAGASHVIVEARESGTVGVFDRNGNIDQLFVQDVTDAAKEMGTRLIWEAPEKEQQVHLIQTLGSNVHLGNIAYSDVLSVETLRRGLRGDTAARFAQRSAAPCE
ncbi:phosphosulfolactate synthase [Brevibacillus panacihumi]|uniref:Phosphosulfolactate synthase n=1 Tax=Brevibacillus panacihumi TaxID=497735 RepID=A0A3M8CHA4_9BACL|nr:phosphosulfolactate synthase [Brevibacillus panacihumi]RNB75070.1 phosphosulfolactate synthase [Brevibacillus panacihumi]